MKKTLAFNMMFKHLKKNAFLKMKKLLKKIIQSDIQKQIHNDF